MFHQLCYQSNGLPTYELKKLQFVQNAAARIVTLTKKSDHISPVLHALNWLPVKSRFVFKILLLVYKGLNGLAPVYISDVLHYCTCSRSLRSGSQKLLDIPKSCLKTYGDRAFVVDGPRLWNEPPSGLKHSKSIAVCKKDLKTQLFRNAFSDDF